MPARYLILPFLVFFGTSCTLIWVHRQHVQDDSARPIRFRYVIAPAGAAIVALLVGLFSLAVSTEYRMNTTNVQPAGPADMPSVDWAINH